MHAPVPDHLYFPAAGAVLAGCLLAGALAGIGFAGVIGFACVTALLALALETIARVAGAAGATVPTAAGIVGATVPPTAAAFVVVLTTCRLERIAVVEVDVPAVTGAPVTGAPALIAVPGCPPVFITVGTAAAPA